MKFSREQYQHGSVCEVPRSQGFTREFRFYTTAPDGKRKLWVQTLVCGCLGLRVSEAPGLKWQDSDELVSGLSGGGPPSLRGR
jgi:hypothetical protein